MEYNSSFYGGRPGAPFILVKQYENISKMEEDFKLPNCSVGYGEYVIISTDKVRDSDNGKIYVRDLNGNPLYMGKIAGPTGPVVGFTIGDYNYVKKMAEQETKTGYSKVGQLELKDNFVNQNHINYALWYDPIEKDENGNPKTAVAHLGLQIPKLKYDFVPGLEYTSHWEQGSFSISKYENDEYRFYTKLTLPATPVQVSKREPDSTFPAGGIWLEID